MLDLVRRTCDGASGMDNFEGVYEPDPEQVREWQEREAEQYNGELCFVNLGPQEVKRRLEAGACEEDMEALEYAEAFWRKAGGYSGAMEAGSVFRGQDRVVRNAGSMAELVGSPASAVVVMGSLAIGGVPTMSAPVDGESYADRGIIDWSLLLSQGPLPETEDWF